MLKSVVGRAVPGAEIVMVGTQAQAVEEASRANLLLINRVLDGEFADDSGVELIRRLAGGAGGGAVGGAGGKDGMRATLMLVSNYADAQAEAVAAGGGAAVPGFGKSSAGTAATAAAIRAGAARK
jgi:hypothetical protein